MGKEAPDVLLSCVAMDFLPQDETMKERQREEYFLRRLEALEFQMRFLGVSAVVPSMCGLESWCEERMQMSADGFADLLQCKQVETTGLV